MDKRPNTKLPARYASEMVEASKRTRIPLTELIAMGWEVIRKRVMAIEPITTIDMEAVYKKNAKGKQNA